MRSRSRRPSTMLLKPSATAPISSCEVTPQRTSSRPCRTCRIACCSSRRGVAMLSATSAASPTEATRPPTAIAATTTIRLSTNPATQAASAPSSAWARVRAATASTASGRPPTSSNTASRRRRTRWRGTPVASRPPSANSRGSSLRHIRSTPKYMLAATKVPPTQLTPKITRSDTPSGSPPEVIGSKAPHTMPAASQPVQVMSATWAGSCRARRRARSPAGPGEGVTSN